MKALLRAVALAVALGAGGGVAAVAVDATPAYAGPRVCIINGERQDCPAPDYENDCEGELRRSDCNADVPEAVEPAAPARGDTATPVRGAPTAKRQNRAPRSETGLAPTPEGADGYVPPVTEPAPVVEEPIEIIEDGCLPATRVEIVGC